MSAEWKFRLQPATGNSGTSFNYAQVHLLHVCLVLEILLSKIPEYREGTASHQ